LGLSTLTSCFVNANRDLSKADPAQPSDFYYFKPEEDKTCVAPETADTFFSLIDDHRLPGWVVPLAPVEELSRARSGGKGQMPRALIGDGLLLVAPTFEQGWVRSPLGFFAEHPNGLSIELMDVDSGRSFWITLPTGLESNVWMVGIQFLLME
jgi:hypothetical protein